MQRHKERDLGGDVPLLHHPPPCLQMAPGTVVRPRVRWCRFSGESGEGEKLESTDTLDLVGLLGYSARNCLYLQASGVNKSLLFRPLVIFLLPAQSLLIPSQSFRPGIVRPNSTLGQQHQGPVAGRSPGMGASREWGKLVVGPSRALQGGTQAASSGGDL